jgi:methionine synthase II (cobalamin-independent)
MHAYDGEQISRQQPGTAQDAALRDTIARFEETGSPVITDGEQTKPSFATYPINGLQNLAAGGVVIPFADGHTRELPKLTGGPFRYSVYASTFLRAAQQYAHRPVKQAVISASALSLIYPQSGLPNYSRDAFLDDLVREAQRDIRQCLDSDAACVQVDFTEGRLALKLDPSQTPDRSAYRMLRLSQNQVLLTTELAMDFTKCAKNCVYSEVSAAKYTSSSAGNELQGVSSITGAQPHPTEVLCPA